jgi:hypothetical protein
VDLVFIPENAEEMGRALSSETWLPLRFLKFELEYEASGAKSIHELGDHDINLDTVRQTNLLDNAVAEDKCMLTVLSTY